MGKLFSCLVEESYLLPIVEKSKLKGFGNDKSNPFFMRLPGAQRIKGGPPF